MRSAGRAARDRRCDDGDSCSATVSLTFCSAPSSAGVSSTEERGDDLREDDGTHIYGAERTAELRDVSRAIDGDLLFRHGLVIGRDLLVDLGLLIIGGGGGGGGSGGQRGERGAFPAP